MLSRNNGVTFRANKILKEDEAEICLSQAAIVNGCQTTMSLVHCQQVPDSCKVQVKVVETDDAWDIAMAANYQNPVARIDLDLAQYLRPQLVRRVATSLGYAVDSTSENSASAVLSTIYSHKIDYDELKLLYLGLFSRKPSNLFEANYTELRADILSRLYEDQDNEERIFSVLLLLLKESRFALEECQRVFAGEEYSFLFRRFYREDRPRYRAFVAVTAVAASARDDLSQRSPDIIAEVSRVRSFLGQARAMLENDPVRYRRIFVLAFQALADSLLDVPEGKDEGDIAQEMFRKVSGMAFSSLYKRVLMRIDADSLG